MTFTLMDDTVITVELYPDKRFFQKKEAQILRERMKENMELIYVIIRLLILEAILLVSRWSPWYAKSALREKQRNNRHLT